MKRTKQKSRDLQMWQEHLAILEKHWRQFSAHLQTRIDAGKPLTIDHKWQLRDLLTEGWRGVGIHDAEAWKAREWKVFKQCLETKISEWESKEKRKELFTLG